ncbi:HlyD family type I secretion periplasmic adaptor subunit [Rhodopseudomonas sp. P2A-2r]|uniref:HlyD family type I secretion periplasmic adaptor subunit n=1 Tax=Rhodopseudomonas sp. P2A-2r TaxID=2991972 RepID=UPI0022349A3E|nr:HlyD family type I secretion periplasmic adaptor subunit [Rhodopseudomonas sp. P2A-2r]UZE50497.1 HlyD family type I secretion periplasmic adaptor subunit [Rhodopseudomonas sp. P2A-2r]
MPTNAAIDPAPAKVAPLRVVRRRDELEFLPAALEIIETPASPMGRAIAFTIIAFFVLALVWACLGRIDIIATAQGKIVPTGRTKTIQPLEAGTVTAIRVRDGDKVHEGDVLLEIDRTISTAERNRVGYELLRARLDAARLTALRAGLATNTASDFVPPAAPAYEILRTRAAMLAQAEQQAAKIVSLDQQVAQKSAEADGIAALIDKLESGLSFIAETAALREKLLKQEFGNRLAYLDAQLKLADQRSDLIVQKRRLVETAAAKAALEASREQTRAEYARNIMTDLAEAEQKAGQLAEDIIKAERKMNDQVLRAPVDGTVQQLAIHTVGGVVSPAQQLMAIVPADSKLEAEAMLPNKDIGFVTPGQFAEIKIDTFNFTKYGLLRGEVINVSQDAIAREKPVDRSDSGKTRAALSESSEPQGQELVYAARVSLNRTQMQVEDKIVSLAPGMAVTVEIKTGRRRVIEYLLSPLLRYGHEAARER